VQSADSDTTSELTKLEDELSTVFAENEGLYCRIRQSQAANGQMKAHLCDLQSLLNTVQDFVKDIQQDCE
jgi:hypothetical protein